MKKYFSGFFYSLPVQLFFLHFRRYQVFLVFWYVLFATVTGHFMKSFGASSLFLAPEYMDEVNILSTFIVGVSVGVFIMSWNITTFILFTKNIRFLATTAQPFLKYCINNGIVPMAFLILYFFRMIRYSKTSQLLSTSQSLILALGLLLGLAVSVSMAFMYFYGIDKRIYRRLGRKMERANKIYTIAERRNPLPREKGEMRVDYFLTATFVPRKARDVRHYSQEFLDSIFKRHHLAAVVAVFFAFVFLIMVGFLSEQPTFQIPAAASVAIFFAILIAVAGAFAVFLKTWSIPLLIAFYFLMNWAYEMQWIDPRNKLYGINYNNKKERPQYSRSQMMQLASQENMEADKKIYQHILNNWKEKQRSAKPVMYFINVSGGGTRSAAFAMDALQALDSITHHNLMNQTFMITGASGGLLGAAYFRELYWLKLQGKKINLQDKKHSDDISKDLLNPLFSSFVTNDLIAPVQNVEINGYTYNKDRGYAFEEKLNLNTNGLLNKKLGDYLTAERRSEIPVLMYNSVITMDGRRVTIAAHPARFLMKTITDSSKLHAADPDAIDFTSLFAKQNPYNLRVLSALRVNATFPYVLPNVLLPTNPVMDLMDAGLRDNYGIETTLRFINIFKDWLNENTSKIIIIQIRGRRMGEWDNPYMGTNFFGQATSPLFLLQSNYYKLQDYYFNQQLQFMYNNFSRLYRLNFQYVPSKADAHASLSFHLTTSEKKDIREALKTEGNASEFRRLMELSKE